MSQDGDMKPLQSFLNVSQLKLRKEGRECMIKYMRKKCLYSPTYITCIQQSNLFSPQITWYPKYLFSSHLQHRDTLLFHSQRLVLVGFTLSLVTVTRKRVCGHTAQPFQSTKLLTVCPPTAFTTVDLVLDDFCSQSNFNINFFAHFWCI